MPNDHEHYRLIMLLADIRKAAGDPTGKLMQDELVASIAALRVNAERYQCLRDGDWCRGLKEGRSGLLVGNFGEDLDAAIDTARAAK